MKLKELKKSIYRKPKIYSKKIKINFMWGNNPLDSEGVLLAGCWGGNSDWYSRCGW